MKRTTGKEIEVDEKSWPVRGGVGVKGVGVNATLGNKRERKKDVAN